MECLQEHGMQKLSLEWALFTYLRNLMLINMSYHSKVKEYSQILIKAALGEINSGYYWGSLFDNYKKLNQPLYQHVSQSKNYLRYY